MSSEVQRLLIARTRLGETKKHEPLAELFIDNPKLEYPELRVFDLTMLEMVNIDPNTLNGEFVYKRYWAYYVESDKVNGKGRQYRDVQYLEPCGTQQAQAGPDTDKVLEALRHLYTRIEQAEERVVGEVLALAERIETVEKALDAALFNGNVTEALEQQHEAGVAELRAKSDPGQMERELDGTLVEPTPEQRHKAPAPEDAPSNEAQAEKKFRQLAVSAAMTDKVSPGYLRGWEAKVSAKLSTWRDALFDLEKKVA